MDRGDWQELVDNLRGAKYPYGQNAAGYLLFHRVEFDAGLTDAEVIAVERRFILCELGGSANQPRQCVPKPAGVCFCAVCAATSKKNLHFGAKTGNDLHLYQ